MSSTTENDKATGFHLGANIIGARYRKVPAAAGVLRSPVGQQENNS